MSRSSSLTPRLRYWREHLRACARRKQPLSQYAAEYGLAVGALYEAKSRLKRLGALPAPAPALQFVRVRDAVMTEPASAPVLCRVRLPNGVIVESAGAELGAVLAKRGPPAMMRPSNTERGRCATDPRWRAIPHRSAATAAIRRGQGGQIP
jgi:hypothetical protein